MSSSVLSSQDISDALSICKQLISVDAHACSSHKVAIADGLEQDKVIEAIAKYLLASIAMIINVDFSIVSTMIGMSADSKKALLNDVEQLLGKDNNISQDKREDERDPWILEGLGHLLLSLSREIPELSVGGDLKALLLVHDDVKDHGIDLLGILKDAGILGILIGEAKASKMNASKAATVACKSFSEIEQAKHDMHVRRLTLVASGSLTKDEKALLCEAMWKDRRRFVPIISHSSTSKFEPKKSRTKTFGSLAVGSDGILLISLSLSNYDDFFNNIADKVRELAKAL